MNRRPQDIVTGLITKRLNVDDVSASEIRAALLALEQLQSYLDSIRSGLSLRLMTAEPEPTEPPETAGPEPTTRLLTVAQAAELTQMSRRQLYNAARRADWRPWVVRINARTLRFRESGLRRWLVCQSRVNT